MATLIGQRNSRASRVSMPVRLPLFASLLALACAPRESPSAGATGGTIVVSAAADVDALVPPLVAQLTGKQVTEQIFDHLADIGADLNTVGDAGFTPALAESWSWAGDSLSIAFHLNPRARWHDGTPVRARDVSFSFSLYADPVVASPTAPLLANIDSVTVADSLTAVAWFKRRKPEQFFDVVYQLLIVPQHLLDAVPRARLRTSDFARTPVGSGRFRFVRWTPSASLEIVADTLNYRGRARLDRVVWTIATDFNTAATKFIAGEADVFEFLRPEQIAAVAGRDDLRVHAYPSLDYAFVQFNLRDPANRSRAHPIFGERAARVALSMAVDREALVRNVFDTLGRVSIGPTARGSPLADTSIAQIRYDTAAAARLLDSLGWRDSDGDRIRDRRGRRLAFDLLVPSSSRNRVRMAVLLQEQLRRVGAAVRIEQLEYGAFTERQLRRRFDATFGAWHMDAGSGGIQQTWGTVGSRAPNGMNYGAYESATFDAHVDSALTMHDLQSARDHFRRALETIVNDAPAIWMYEPIAVLGIHRRLRPTRVRTDAWWAGLSDWTIDPERRLPRDELGLARPPR